jgi:drug/metabolite transporter (DMT)-like permease
MDKRTRNGILFALTAASGYAFLPIYTKWIYQYSAFSAIDIAGWRFMMAVPVFWGLLLVRDRTVGNACRDERLPRWKLMGLGVMLLTGALAAFYGLSLIETGVYVVLFRTYPAMVLVASAFMGERLPFRGWIVLGMVLFGVGLMILNPNDVDLAFTGTYFIGILVALYNAAIIAAYNIFQGKVIRGVRAKARASAWTLTGALFAVVPLLVVLGLAPIPNWQTLASLFGLAMMCTVLPIVGIYESISLIGASRFVLVASVEPAIALGLAYLIFGEVLTIPQLIGGAIILGSILLLEVPLPGRRKQQPPPTGQPLAEGGD